MIRLDKLLWYLRLAKTRSLAQSMIEAGHMRLNGRRVDRSHQPVLTGDRLVLPLPAGVLAIEILAEPQRRGPAPEARSCYRVLDGSTDFALAAGQRNHAGKGDLQP